MNARPQAGSQSAVHRVVATAESAGIQAATLIGAVVVAAVFGTVWLTRPTLRRAL